MEGGVYSLSESSAGGGGGGISQRPSEGLRNLTVVNQSLKEVPQWAGSRNPNSTQTDAGFEKRISPCSFPVEKEYFPSIKA